MTMAWGQFNITFPRSWLWLIPLDAIGVTQSKGVNMVKLFLFMLANGPHDGTISLVTASVKTLVGPSPLHCPSYSTTPDEWVLVGWRLDWLHEI